MIAPKQKIRICLVDDDPSVLCVLENLIHSYSEMEVCGAYLSGEEALAHTDWETVHVLLTDLLMPGMSGIELIKKAVALNPKLLPLALTGCDRSSTIFLALSTGACGYLLKGSCEPTLKDSIFQLVNGGAPMSPPIARLLITHFQLSEQLKDCESLSLREIAVLKLVAGAFSYDEIGDHLSISRHTVHTHIKHLYGKLHAQSRNDALNKARMLGYIEDL